jgi:hypothetical protein
MISDLISLNKVHKITINSSGTSQALQSALFLTTVRVNFLLGSLRSKLSNNVKFGPHCLSLTSIWYNILVPTFPQKAVNGKKWSLCKP